jgi:hypothetical protein
LSGPRTHCAISGMHATCLVRRLLRIYKLSVRNTVQSRSS